jgi:hypothetical protein
MPRGDGLSTEAGLLKNVANGPDVYVCKSPGIVSGDLQDFGRPKYELDEDGFVEELWHPVIVLRPKWFECSVCGWRTSSGTSVALG